MRALRIMTIHLSPSPRSVLSAKLRWLLLMSLTYGYDFKTGGEPILSELIALPF
jgi:hypothetical protein